MNTARHNQLHRNIAALALAAGALLAAPAGFAEVSVTTMTSIGYDASTRADVKNTDNDMQVGKASAAVSLAVESDAGSSVILALNSAYYDYDFGKTSPWGSVKEFGALVMTEQPVAERWSAVGLGFIQTAYEDGAEAGDGITWAAGMGARYRSSETLSYIIGVAYLSRMEDDGVVIPVIGIEWQINDRWTLDGIFGLTATYDLSGDKTTLMSFGIDYELGDFRLKDDPATGAERAVRPEGAALFASIHHQFTPNFGVMAKVSGYSEQEFKTYSDGKKLSTMKVEESAFAGVGVVLTF